MQTDSSSAYRLLSKLGGGEPRRWVVAIAAVDEGAVRWLRDPQRVAAMAAHAQRRYSAVVARPVAIGARQCAVQSHEVAAGAGVIEASGRKRSLAVALTAARR